MKKIYCVTLLSLIGFSCAKPKLSNLKSGRYIYCGNTDSCKAYTRAVDVGLTVVPIEESYSAPEKPVRFVDLRDSLPHIFMRQIGGKTNSAEDFVKNLSSIIIPSPGQQKETKINYTEKEIQLRLSCLKKYYNFEKLMHPNTRLEFLTVKINICDANFKFLKINKLQNEYDEIDLGKLSRENETNIKSNLNVTGGASSSAEYSNGNNDVYKKNRDISKNETNSGSYNYSESGNSRSANIKSQTGLTASGDLSYQNRESIQEALDVRLKRLRVGYTNTDNTITIAQRGRIGGDISDNIFINTVIKVIKTIPLSVFSFKHLNSSSTGKWGVEKKVVELPEIQNYKLKLSYSFEGAIRAVHNGWFNKRGSNALEYDDKVTFYKILSDYEEVSVDISDLYNYPYIFKIKNCKDDDDYNLYIEYQNNIKDVKMLFTSRLEINEFIKTITELLENIKNNKIDSTHLTNQTFNLYFSKGINDTSRIYIVHSDPSEIDIGQLKKLCNFQVYRKNN